MRVAAQPATAVSAVTGRHQVVNSGEPERIVQEPRQAFGDSDTEHKTDAGEPAARWLVAVVGAVLASPATYGPRDRGLE